MGPAGQLKNPSPLAGRPPCFASLFWRRGFVLLLASMHICIPSFLLKEQSKIIARFERAASSFLQQGARNLEIFVILRLRSLLCRRRKQNVGGLIRLKAAEFSFGFGQKKKSESNPFGGENPYRVFGVTEDAPYEEVEMAYKELVAENEGNDKYLIKLEMMKEKIFDDRLKARMSGALKSKIKDSPFEKKLQVDPQI